MKDDRQDRCFDSIDANFLQLHATCARMEGHLAEIKRKVNVLAEDFKGLTATLHRISGNIEASLIRMDHVGRITKLESRPS